MRTDELALSAPVAVVGLTLVERPACPICGSEDYDPHLRIDCFDIRRCADCRFLFTGQTLPADELRSFYAQGYGGRRHELGQQINARVNHAILQRLLGVQPLGSLLDIGSGYGFLLDQVRSRSGSPVRLLGVELSEAEREFSRNRLALDVRASLEEAVGEAPFDVATLFEVIEHIPEPVPFLEAVRARLKPEGALVIGTDNFESSVVRTMGTGFPKWIPHQHISLFSPATLRAAIERAGFRVDAMLSFTPWELRVRHAIFTLTAGRKGRFEFNLASVLAAENAGSYRAFEFRRLVNRLWAQATAGTDLDGELMFVLARPTANLAT